MNTNQNELYLRHNGIKGQQWGVKNGPPYPLSPEDHKAVINNGDVKTLKEHTSEFKDWEVRAAIDRFNLNQEVERLNGRLVEKGAKEIKDEEFIKRANNLANKVGAVGNVLGKTSYASEHAMKTYNAVARTMNSLLGKDMPVIDLKANNKTKKQKMREEAENRRKKNLERIDEFKKKRMEDARKLENTRNNKRMQYEMDIEKKKAMDKYNKQKNKKSLFETIRDKKMEAKSASTSYIDNTTRERIYNKAKDYKKKYGWTDKQYRSFLEYNLKQEGFKY